MHLVSRYDLATAHAADLLEADRVAEMPDPAAAGAERVGAHEAPGRPNSRPGSGRRAAFAAARRIGARQRFVTRSAQEETPINAQS